MCGCNGAKALWRYLSWAAVFAMAALLFCTPAVFARSDAPQSVPARNRYRLDMAYDPLSQSVTVDETITIVNRCGRPLRAVWLSVYSNALRRTATVPVEYSRWSDAFPAGYVPGGVDFVSVTVNGEPVHWAMYGSGETFMYVPCSLNEGDEAELRLLFSLLLSENALSLGAGKNDLRLTDFYPILAVYDDAIEDFILNPWTAFIEPVTSGISDYEISFAVPDGLTVLSTGEITGSESDGGYNVVSIRAQGVRDVSLCVLAGPVEREARTAGGTLLRIGAGTKAAAQAIADAAETCMNLYEAWFGAPGTAELTLVQTDLYRDGVSKPGLVQISSSLCAGGRSDELTLAVYRLCAAQWFGCLVGNDPENAPWLSEALSSYAALLCVEETQGHSAYLRMMNGDALSSLMVTVPGGLYVDSAASRFTSLDDYILVVRDRGICVLHEIRELMGNDAFLRALRLYVDGNRDDNAAAEQFAAALNQATGERWDEYLAYELQNVASDAGRRTFVFE